MAFACDSREDDKGLDIAAAALEQLLANGLGLIVFSGNGEAPSLLKQGFSGRPGHDLLSP